MVLGLCFNLQQTLIIECSLRPLRLHYNTANLGINSINVFVWLDCPQVKICDMQMRGTPRDLLPGDPVCSPMATVLAEATTQLIRILHRTDHWTHRINKTMIERLHKIKACFRESASTSAGGQRLKKSRSVQSREEHDAQREIQETPPRPEEERGRHARQHGLGELSEHHLRTLCTEVWPVLAIIGGADAGLRVGGRCVHKQTGRHATLLGVVKEGSTSAKVQWDEAEITIRYQVKSRFTLLFCACCFIC